MIRIVEAPKVPRLGISIAQSQLRICQSFTNRTNGCRTCQRRRRQYCCVCVCVDWPIGVMYYEDRRALKRNQLFLAGHPTTMRISQTFIGPFKVFVYTWKKL